MEKPLLIDLGEFNQPAIYPTKSIRKLLDCFDTSYDITAQYPVPYSENGKIIYFLDIVVTPEGLHPSQYELGYNCYYIRINPEEYIKTCLTNMFLNINKELLDAECSLRLGGYDGRITIDTKGYDNFFYYAKTIQL